MDGVASAQSFIGRQVLHYKVVQRLGAGGMGVVYKAIDLRLDRPVALKFLPPAFCYDEQLKQRLEQEARSASALDHNNIATVFGIEEADDGQLFIVMAYYDGEPLSSKLRRGLLPIGRAVDYASQIARGLAEAHHKGIIHRDIKPSNVIITSQGVAKIVDFGLARLAGLAPTQSGSTMGTAAYMSPEQAQGYPLDQRTDVWSLGVLLYEMAAGTLPFPGENPQAVLFAVVNQEVPELSDRVPGDLRTIIYRALSRDPASRYQTAAAMAKDLAALQQILSTNEETPTIAIDTSEETAARGSGSVHRRKARPSRTKILLAIALVAVLATSVFGVYRKWGELLKLRHTAQTRRVVVLPFTNAGQDPTGEALRDGLVEVITAKLASLEQLSVVPASEVRRLHVSNIEEARRQFKADLVVEGNVQQDSSGVKLNIDLVDPVQVRQLGSVPVSDARGNFAAIQDDAVAKLARLMEISVKPDAVNAASTDGRNVPAAYESYLKGVGLMQRYNNPENVDKSIRLFRETINTDPTFALAYSKLGEAQWLKYKSIDKDPKLLQDARQNVNRALKLDSQLASAYVTLGSLDDGAGQHELAVHSFEQALKLEPRNPQAYQGIGRAYELLGRLGDAEAMFRKAIDLDPDSWDGYSRLGTFYFRQGRFEDAVALFRQVVELVPQDALAYSNLGGALSQAGKPKEAVEMLRKSIELGPSYSAYSNLGMIYYKDRKYADAVSMYEKALQMNGNDHEVWINLADSYVRLRGLTDKARTAYRGGAHAAEEFLKQNPKDPDALCDLAAAKVRLGEKEEAKRLARYATALAPGNSEIELSAAEVFEVAGEREQAVTLIAAALEHGAIRDDIVRNHPDLEKPCKDPKLDAVLRRQ